MHVSPLLLLFIASAILNASLAIYGWRHRHLPGAIAFSLAMFLFTFLPLSQALNISSSDFTIKVIALKSRVEIAGIGAIAWLVMVMQFSGYAQLVNRRLLLALSSVPLAIMILNWTENPLFRSGYHLELVGASPALRWTNGPIFWVGLLYLNAVLLTPIYLLWRSYGHISPLSFRQTMALSISTILPLIINVLSQVGFAPVRGINFPFAAGPVMGLIVAWAILRYHIFDLIPIARGLLIESMNDGVLVLDTQNRIVDINPAMQELIGQAALGQSAESAFTPWPDLIARFRGVTEARAEIAIEGNPPESFDLRISSLIDRRGKLTGRLIVVRDITRHKQTENALRTSENNFRRILESAPDAILIVDQAGNITLANAQCEKIFGYTQAELLGQPVEILLPERLHEIHKIHRADYYRDPQMRPMGADAKWELTALHRDGREFPVEISLSPLDTETGLLTMAAIRNVTERKRMEAQLRLQATALEATANAIAITDFNGVIQWVNLAFTQLTGYSFVESIGQPVQLIRSGKHSTTFYENLWKTIRSGVVWEDEIINRHKDGSEYFEHQTITPVRDERGEVSHFIAIKQDITQRKHAEEALRRQNDYLEALHQISLDLLNRRNVDDVLNAIITNATRLLDAPYGDLDIVEGDVMITRAYTENQAFERDLRTRRGESGTASWQAYDTRQIVIIDDYTSWPHRHPAFESIPLHATIIVPLVSDDQCLGVFSLARTEPNRPFTPDEIQLTSLLARQAALVLDNVQLHSATHHEIEERKRSEEALRRQNDYLSALHEITLGLINHHDPDVLLEAILHHAANLMNAHHALVDIVDPEKNILIQKVAIGNYIAQLGFRTRLGEGLSGSVWASGEKLMIPDYSIWENRLPDFTWLRSVASVPMKVQGKVIGVIGVAFDEPDRTFTPEEIDLLQRFANLASMALDNAQLITGATRQSQELSLLHEVRTAIASEIDLTRIVKRTVEAIAETFGYTLVSLYLLKHDMLILQHQVGYEHVIPTIPITAGISGQVIRTGKPVFLEDAHSDPSFLGALEGIISEVAVPIFDEGRAVGIINIESRYGVKLTEADLRLMVALSDQISVAIGRARLYNSLQRNNERLSILHEISLDVLNQHEFDNLLQTITDQSVKLQDAVVGYIALKEGDELVDRAITPRDLPYQITRGSGENDTSPAWQVFESREPFITDDFSALPNIRPETAALGVKAAILLPILYGDTCRGVLGTGRTQPNYPFNEEDINFGGLFAKLAAVALDNAQMHNTLREESIRDPLTGLFNRRFMQEALAQEVMKANRTSRSLAVVMFDLDHFKRLNDTFGHDAGDEALRRLGLLLKTTIRGSDVACRYGGEEFTLILPEASLSDAVQRMEQLRQDIKTLAIRHQGKSISHLSGSFGIAVYPNHGSTDEALLKSADEALYRAKQTGRDRVIAASI